MTETEAAAMQALMEAVVTEGTASRLKDLSYTGCRENRICGIRYREGGKPCLVHRVCTGRESTGLRDDYYRGSRSRRRLCRSDCKADF